MWDVYHRGVEQIRMQNRTAALAGAVASEMNDELTVIINGVLSERPTCEDLAAVERASLRCAGIAKGLMQFAERNGVRRPLPLRSLLEEDLF